MTNNPPDLRSFAIDVVKRLRAAGFIAYWAGGCVRDLVMHHPPKDFDVATSARPEQVQQLFKRTIAIGASFGVINVLGGGGRSVEVATFRTDGKYSDARRPDEVVFSSPEEDALRRDFTINGMFFDPIEEKILDFVGGEADLERGVIRAIGDPIERITEDRLRMLRGVRFAARFGFTIDGETFAAIHRMADTLSAISVERILAETRAILESPTRVHGIELLRETALFPQVFPELSPHFAEEKVRQETLAVLGIPKESVPLALGVAAMVSRLSPLEGASIASSILRRLKSANDDHDRAVWLVSTSRQLDGVDGLHPHQIKRILAAPARADLLRLIEAIEIVETGASKNTDSIRQLIHKWGEAGIDPPFLVTGDDLIELGYRPGREFKFMLDTIRDAQLDGQLTDREQAIDWTKNRWPKR
jgi:tRNA nucleotidyltransferase/poly(A) polymerase